MGPTDGSNNKGAILTITDRKTGYLIMENPKHGKDAKQVAQGGQSQTSLLKAQRTDILHYD